MGTEIHAMKTPDGWRYRLWQNTSDVYFTEPLDEEGISKAYLEYAIEKLRQDHDSLFGFTLKRCRDQALEKWEVEVNE